MPTPEHFDGFLLFKALVLGVLVMQGVDLFLRIRGRKPQPLEPQPLEVREAHEYARKDELEKAQEEWRRDRDQLHARLGGMERGIREEIRRDIEQLHEKLNQVALATAKLEATAALLNQTITGLGAKLDRLAEKESVT